MYMYIYLKKYAETKQSDSRQTNQSLISKHSPKTDKFTNIMYI